MAALDWHGWMTIGVALATGAPGGYRSVDYVHVDLPLSLVVGVAVQWAIPHFWAF